MADSVFQGKRVLVTAGPTQEALDPVRYIGNHSSGKMGYAIADTLARRGAKVTLISGPVCITLDNSAEIDLISVTSAREMYDTCLEYAPGCQIIVKSAAVSDYRPKDIAQHKIKKDSDTLMLELVKNPDILEELGRRKSKGQLLIGFALETENAMEYAKAKMKRKNLDAIVMNMQDTEGSGFRHDTNQVSIILKNGTIFDFPMKLKTEVAEDIANTISSLI